MEKIDLTFEEFRKKINDEILRCDEEIWIHQQLDNLKIPYGIIELHKNKYQKEALIVFHIKGGIATMYATLDEYEIAYIVYPKKLKMIELGELSTIQKKVEEKRKQVEIMDYVLKAERIKGIFTKE